MDTVENPRTTIYSKWRTAVEPVVGKNNTSMDNSQIASKFPYAKLSLLGLPTTSSDLEGDECAVTPTVQIDIFTNGTKALSKAYDIDAVSHEAMVNMRFRRTYGPELTPNADDSIKRLVSRYSRVLGAGDSL